MLFLEKYYDLLERRDTLTSPESFTHLIPKKLAKLLKRMLIHNENSRATAEELRQILIDEELQTFRLTVKFLF